MFLIFREDRSNTGNSPEFEPTITPSSLGFEGITVRTWLSLES